MPHWDDKQYLKFHEERTRPASELLARVPLDAPASIVDLGCGPGNSTALLKLRWPAARVIGVDNSREMLDRARNDYPDGEWIVADALDFTPSTSPDLIFANALLQWLPNHAGAFPKLIEQLNPGGVLAVQMPCNFDEPSHRLMRELGSPYDARLKEVRSSSPVHSAKFYYDLLSVRAKYVDIWQTTYEHVMKDAESIVDWVKGTGLRPYLEVLSEDERLRYLEMYTCAINAAYPPQADGRRLFSFPRLFVVAIR